MSYGEGVGLRKPLRCLVRAFDARFRNPWIEYNIPTNREDLDQTTRMHRFIWVFTLGLWYISCFLNNKNKTSLPTYTV